ncbi:GPI ethanolamine phosphate transferase 2 [Zancudomyces culisetae]|uniref:GPI ethanolamine phosphate transferase 2 n=1 Tax=Zancudomyces culisetae TaxID=1213189 RepID=A0A1R1PWD7_ZANCU|nr:GPI ethanolamine phosphate transferase 2 [Zancudomyces culisetae]|eukprot:OMH85223.1 GPI ethanolamine phosphate transferase 2 [Zancudomyces culisetae]
MPRLKALMTGMIPGFMDAVLNLVETQQASSESEEQEDSLIWQLKNTGKKRIHMYGDDTWMRLFSPETFAKSDGTTSFYVADTVEVDYNVTRHIAKEMSTESQKEWDVLILHYLGLDHIGHLEGPNSLLMGPKQREMDQVVKEIYENSGESTLIVMLGDHGMNQKGNHGGGSLEEISTGMVFMSSGLNTASHWSKKNANLDANTNMNGKTIDTRVIDQTDLVPTLSLLMGVPIPQNSLGIPIPELFEDYKLQDQVKIYEIGAIQINRVIEATIPSTILADVTATGVEGGIAGRPKVDMRLLEYCGVPDSDGNISNPGIAEKDDMLECLYWRTRYLHQGLAENRYQENTQIIQNNIIEGYRNYGINAREKLSRIFSGYKLDYMLAGMLVVFTSLILFLVNGFYKMVSGRGGDRDNQVQNSSITGTTRGGVNTQHKITTKTKAKATCRTKIKSVEVVLALVLGTVSIAMYASSFIEEEHMIWFFLAQSVLMFDIFCIAKEPTVADTEAGNTSSIKKRRILSIVGIMTVLRVIKLWTSNGVKWASAEDAFNNENYYVTKLIKAYLFYISNTGNSDKTMAAVAVEEKIVVYLVYSLCVMVLFPSIVYFIQVRKYPSVFGHVLTTTQEQGQIMQDRNRDQNKHQLRYHADVYKYYKITINLQRLLRAGIMYASLSAALYRLKDSNLLLLQNTENNTVTFLLVAVFKAALLLVPQNEYGNEMLSLLVFFSSGLCIILSAVVDVYRQKANTQSLKSNSLFFVYKVDGQNHTLNVVFWTDILFSITPVLFMLGKPITAPILILLYTIYYLLSFSPAASASTALSSRSLLILFVLFNAVFFIGFGNTNTLSSIDLSSAYCGFISPPSYSLETVASGINWGYLLNNLRIVFNVFVSNWVGPIFLYFGSLVFASRSRNYSHSSLPILDLLNLLLGSLSVVCFNLLISTTVLRNHLFIWSVFSPKLLYLLAWSVFILCISFVSFSIYMLHFTLFYLLTG